MNSTDPGKDSRKEIEEFQHQEWLRNPRTQIMLTNLQKVRQNLLSKAENLSNSVELDRQLLSAVISSNTIKQIIEAINKNNYGT